MKENEPNWADKVNVGLNAVQVAQLQGLQSSLRALGALEGEKLRLELNEQQNKERENRLREHIWQLEQAFDRFVQDAPPCAVCAVARQIQLIIFSNQISTASFSQFADKDRVAQFVNLLENAKGAAVNKMSAAERRDWDTYLRYQEEASELQRLIDWVRVERERREQKVKRISKAKKRRETAAEELTTLLHQGGQSGGNENRPSKVGATLAEISAPFVFGGGILGSLIGIMLICESTLPGIGLFVLSLACFPFGYFLQQKGVKYGRIVALDKTLNKEIAETAETGDFTWEGDTDLVARFANGKGDNGEKWAISGLKKFQSTTRKELLDVQRERETFIKNFLHANGLTDDGLFEGQKTWQPDKTAPLACRPEFSVWPGT